MMWLDRLARLSADDLRIMAPIALAAVAVAGVMIDVLV